MHHHTNILATLSLLLPTASPSPLPNTSHPHRRADNRLCGISDYKGNTTPASPLVDDCLQIVENIIGDNQWNPYTMGHHTILEYNTCAFGLDDGNNAIGSVDITKVIVESVMRYSWEDRVGASGAMECEPEVRINHSKETKWSIYHTKKKK